MEQAILSGRWATGEKLPSENVLCRENGLSRASVREVLEALKSRSLVESRRGSGTYVSTGNGRGALRQSISVFSALRSSARDFRELMDLRYLLEGECISALAVPEAAEARAALRRRLVEMEACAHDLATFARADIEFHREMVRHSGHHLFSTILEGVYDGVALRFARATYIEESLTSKTLAEHRAICDALDAGSAARARSLLHAHLRDSRTNLEQLLSLAESAG